MNYQPCFFDQTPYPFPIGKIVCVGRNYVNHVKELNNPMPVQPVIFMKPSTAFANLAQAIQIPNNYACHYETELALLIGKPLKHAHQNEIITAIDGYTLALDLTLRDLQNELKQRGEPWELAKAFDGSCPIAPFIKLQKWEDISHAVFNLYINDKLRQHGDAQQMITDPIQLIEFITRFITLLPGDIILTGTPAGVGELHHGDKLRFTLNETTEFKTRIL